MRPDRPRTTRGAGARAALGGGLLGLLALTACGTTVDSLGYDGADGPPLRPLTGPATYPNLFRDLLSKTDAEINAKIAAAFAQLFHGDPQTQAIYVPVGTDRALIHDIFHDDIRTEGIGYAMLIAVELDKRDELDRLWTYARTTLQVPDGPPAGYFKSFCDQQDVTVSCLDPFGLQQMLMALIFAHDRFTTAGAVDYQTEAKRLLALMRHKQDQNGGVVGGVTDTFDAASGLAFDIPDVSAAGVGRPSIEMPAYYRLWAQATGDPFWTSAAEAARSYWRRSADPTTGLFPVRATFAGMPRAGSENFEAEAYRTQLNLALDWIWTGGEAWTAEEGDRLLAFFLRQGITSYGASFTLDGSVTITASHEPALVAMNGVTALTSSLTAPADRTAFVNAVWNQELVIGIPRYYPGLLDLLALLALGGQLRVY